MPTPNPGVSRDNRLSDEGLQRLESQLTSGRKPSQQVLNQWVKRYGQPAQDIINQYTEKTKDEDNEVIE